MGRRSRERTSLGVQRSSRVKGVALSGGEITDRQAMWKMLVLAREPEREGIKAWLRSVGTKQALGLLASLEREWSKP